MVTIIKLDVIKMVYALFDQCSISKKDFVKCIYLRAFSHDSLGPIFKIFL